jgi:hypothetical protein
MIQTFETKKAEVAAEIQRQAARLMQLQEEHASLSGKVRIGPVWSSSMMLVFRAVMSHTGPSLHSLVSSLSLPDGAGNDQRDRRGAAERRARSRRVHCHADGHAAQHSGRHC